MLTVLKPLWSRAPETASRLRGRIQTVLEAAQALGHIAEDKANPARWKGHLDKLLPRPAKLSRGHQKALPYADVPAFVKRLRSSDGMAALALEFLILTATRTGETLGAQWREIDLDAAIWTVPATRMKTGDEFSVPLIRARSRDPRRGAPRRPQGAGRRQLRVLRRHPETPAHQYGFAMLMRRMNATRRYMALERASERGRARSAHVEYEIAESCLSHRVGNAVSRAYNRSNLLERRRPPVIAAAYSCQPNKPISFSPTA